MKIAVAQTGPIKAEIALNIQRHLVLIRAAIRSNADLIVFPELSITGYEPTLSKKLACDAKDSRFNVFQELTDLHNITICIGMPIRTVEGITISMIIFQPYKERLLYSKKILHEDELPYFVPGQEEPLLILNQQKIAFGICYETLQRSHFIDAVDRNAAYYIASVAKHEKGIEKTRLHFSSIAKEFNIPILMANCVGYCDNFLSDGKSAVWNSAGKQLAQLAEKDEGLLIYDTASETVIKLEQ